ncbi:MAG: ABC transporter substrate-binding protein [Chloroflexi bacterium]|nr:ABC transporter substrate-binding protein [Chloroflexota bacterium]
MQTDNYWLRNRRISRRSALRSAGLIGTGLAGAALIGCSSDDSDDSDDGGGGGGSASPTSTGGGVAVVTPTSVAAEGELRDGGTITVPATATPKEHDANTSLGFNVWHIIGNKAMYQSYGTGEIEPELVDSWEIADDQGLELVMHIREGVAIHDVAPFDGRNFDAEDLAHYLNRNSGLTADDEGIARGAFQRASMTAGLVRAEAVDDNNVRVTMDRPNSSFFAGLIDTRMPMFPREMVDIGFKDPMAMAGTGPYQMSVFEDGVKVEYKRFDNYFEGPAHADKIVQRVLPDRASIVSSFISGEIDYITGLQSHEIEALEGAVPDAQFFSWVAPEWGHWRPNHAIPAFADFRVRKALQLALNYDEIGNGYWGDGWGYMSSVHPEFPEGWSYEKIQQLPGYNLATKEADRAEAARLLEAAGYTNGAGISFSISAASIAQSLIDPALRIQAQLTDLFTDMSIEIRQFSDFAQYSSHQSNSEFDSVSYVITANPDAVLDATAQHHSGGSRNYGNFSNADADALIERAQVELDPAARTELLDEFQQRFVDEWQALIVHAVWPYRAMLRPDFGGWGATQGTWLGYHDGRDFAQWGRLS